MKPLLSILIPTIFGREEQYNKLKAFVQMQADKYPNLVEIIPLKDDKKISIGAKRQMLYDMAQGEYSIQVDDDDWLDQHFVPKILMSIQNGTNPDCICYFEHINFMGQTKVSCHSNDFADWGENYRDENNQYYDYIRTPFFKDVIRTSICKQIPVKDMRYAEDITWSRDLKKSGLIKNEVFINEFMYFYSYTNQTEAQMRERYGIK